MNEAPRRFLRRVLVRQALATMTAFLVVAVFAPRVLGVEGELVPALLEALAGLAAVTLVSSSVLTVLAVRTHRFVLRAIELGSRAIEHEDLGRLADLPSVLSVRFFASGSLASCLVLLPGLRPDKIDDGRAVSLLVLLITILGGAALPHYVMMRGPAVELVELGPPEPLTGLLDALEETKLPHDRIVRRLLLAVVAPVALVGAGAILVTHAHLRTFTEQSRRTTAVLLARTALEPGALTRTGRDEVARAVLVLGYEARVEQGPVEGTEPTFSRDPEGRLVVSTPLEDGRAIVTTRAELDLGVITVGVLLGLAAVLIAGLLGRRFGITLADDLFYATRSVRLLGTETVLRGQTQVARPARFALVTDLGRAIEELALRFRVFAAAQERALDARAAAQRMRGLLFASVSHDLKSPLNAILGFADLLEQGEDLTPPQRESLALIQRRGRELFALIETILDAARVEAGQLHLAPRPTDVRRLVEEAERKARELSGEEGHEVIVEIAEGLPPLPLDPAYAPRALAVVLAHALRTAAADPSSRVIRLSATLPAAPGDKVSIDVELGSRDVSREELSGLFARQAAGRGRGLTLGLSLARSVIELHGGAVQVEGSEDGVPICRVWLPLVAPGRRPLISSIPTLG